MAERIVSPGVFTNEVDQSFLAPGVAQIGAAVVGPTVKGPALIPTQIRSFGEYESIFGPHSKDSYVPMLVNEYLRNGGNVINVTRLLYEDGYTLTNGALAVVAYSGSVSASLIEPAMSQSNFGYPIVTHVLHPTQPVTTDGFAKSLLFLDSTSGSFSLHYSGSLVAGSDSAINFDGSFLVAEDVGISASIDDDSNKYITKVFGRSPKSVDYPLYVQYEDKEAFGNRIVSTTDTIVSLLPIPTYAVATDFSVAATPYITSQKIGSTTKNLIKFHTLSHGTSVNHEVKIGIENVKIAAEVADLNGYGTFDVVVRRVNNTNIPNSPYGQIDDTDSVPVTLEAFRNVNLDPNSVRYISRVIGDRYQTITDAGDLLVNGDYSNLSKFIRVSVDAGVSEGTNDKSLIPFGFRAPKSPIPNILFETSASININVNFASASYVTSQTPSGGSHNAVNYHGFDFTNYNNLNYLAPIPSTGNTTASNADFYLGDVTQDGSANFPTLATAYSGSLQDSLTGGTFTTKVATTTRKFIVPLQGGFDGAKPNLKKYSGTNITAANTFGYDCSSATSTGTKAYNKAFTLLENTDFYDINMLITPGIIDSLHSSVTTKARNLVEARQDTFYVMDTNALTDSISTVESQVTTLDNNYTAAYWPWLKVRNPDGNIPQWVPPSVIVPGALAFNDAVAAPWYAPAGLNRGALTSVENTYITLKQKQRDTLYEARVNPIANFPNDGICIWGQKTLQARPSALDRVNVRRLLITVKKFIASSTKFLVFEQNTAATRNAFLSIVNPYLEQVKRDQGLSAFRVVMDSTNNTPETIDQNILYGQLFLQPTRTAEFIILDFNIQATGASFPE